METTYTLDEIAKNNGKDGNKVWVIIKGSVYDCTTFMDEHPGGRDLILDFAGKNATRDFDDAGHSSEAKKALKQYKIGIVAPEEDRKKKLVIEVPDKENRRSCCSYLTCGLCG